MKVVLFCGGHGMRLREYSETIPKPMVTIGYRPILWHIMKYYAYYGYKDFILCLGYRGDAIKDYFLNYNECLSNDFVLAEGGKKLELLATDIHDWRITFADTGTMSNIGQRLLKVREHLEGEKIFMANYADGLTDLPLPGYLEFFKKRNKIAAFVCVKPSQTFHVVRTECNDEVSSIRHVADSDLWMNGGYFIFKNDIFNYLQPGEELIAEPFQRLISEKQLITYKYAGFWACMDTFKEKQHLDELYTCGNASWEVWKNDCQSSDQLPAGSICSASS